MTESPPSHQVAVMSAPAKLFSINLTQQSHRRLAQQPTIPAMIHSATAAVVAQVHCELQTASLRRERSANRIATAIAATNNDAAQIARRQRRKRDKSPASLDVSIQSSSPM